MAKNKKNRKLKNIARQGRNNFAFLKSAQEQLKPFKSR